MVLDLATLTRIPTGVDRRRLIALFTEKLAAYPEEHVRRAIEHQAKTASWFPTWHDLAEYLELLMDVNEGGT